MAGGYLPAHQCGCSARTQRNLRNTYGQNEWPGCLWTAACPQGPSSQSLVPGQQNVPEWNSRQVLPSGSVWSCKSSFISLQPPVSLSLKMEIKSYLMYCYIGLLWGSNKQGHCPEKTRLDMSSLCSSRVQGSLCRFHYTWDDEREEKRQRGACKIYFCACFPWDIYFS